MDITTLTMIVAILITLAMALIGSVYGGMIAALILTAFCLFGFSALPATPIIPMWISILIVVAEILFISFRVAQGFGIGKPGGSE